MTSVSMASGRAAPPGAASAASSRGGARSGGGAVTGRPRYPSGDRLATRHSTWLPGPCYPGTMAEQDLDAFRRDLRTWLAANVPPDLSPERAARLPEDERMRRLRAWQRKLAEARWVGITWPREYGGRDAGIPEQLAYVEEMAHARAPEIIGNLGIGIAAPPILAYGTEAQKRRLAPRLLNAEHLWCFGFSEPGAGPGLPPLRTQAVLQGGRFEVNRPKLWATPGQHADWGMLLFRPHPQTRRAQGISRPL